MSNNKLKIRIQIQQPPQAIEEIYPEPEVTYEETLDWNKIAIAAALLLSILVLTGYLLFSSGGKLLTRVFSAVACKRGSSVVNTRSPSETRSSAL